MAIARVIMKNSPIFVYDEATSSLDSVTEDVSQFDVAFIPIDLSRKIGQCGCYVWYKLPGDNIVHCILNECHISQAQNPNMYITEILIIYLPLYRIS